MREPATHLHIDRRFCGSPRLLEEGRAEVRMTTIEAMAVDDRGLVHGGFVFGLADYAAMLAVNDPNVVLGGADVRFSAPVRVGDEVLATATMTSAVGRSRKVEVTVDRDEETVMKGVFTCFVLDHHVLGGDDDARR
ncbi:fatty acid biosynthesis transcriptional regulator [bacterium BMS3Abin02]|nr:fatty acid biosynthesis transcriptional regulator [bacterium BMS3Abin02]GBE20970.1 fatty acid biosynthesis transcriptional regulator [bacterium BMS3Bbin01]HDH25326.1 PaaI family thioesterase [Actinomycetota bacterium]